VVLVQSAVLSAETDDGVSLGPSVNVAVENQTKAKECTGRHSGDTFPKSPTKPFTSSLLARVATS
jgi:hypothetical protein